MTTYAKCRDYEEAESFPYVLGEERADKTDYYPCNETLYECWMPDQIEDDEFNIVILLQGFPVRARDIHFDFEEK
jgi:hypothetical protein